MPQYTVTKVYEQPTYDQGTLTRTGAQIVVTFMVGDHGPFTKTFDAATFSGFAVSQALGAFAQELGQLTP